MRYEYANEKTNRELEMRFDEFIKHYISRRIDELEGIRADGCDFAAEITQRDVMNGTYFQNVKADKDFIIRHWDIAGKFYDDFEPIENQINPFKEVSEFVMTMIDKGVRDLINDKSKTIQELWDERIEVTRDIINQIKEELGIEEEIEVEEKSMLSTIKEKGTTTEKNKVEKPIGEKER